MQPAFSVIFLTTFIGAGQGLFLALVAVESGAAWGLFPPPRDAAFYAGGSLLALGLLGAGLVASFFHLGRPERAWRSAAKWRTSWLSREVIVMPAFMGAVALWGFLHWSGWNPAPGFAASAWLGLAGAALALLLYVCTAMIYACLKFLREWHSPLTVANYILLGAASGFTLAAAWAAQVAPAMTDFLAPTALALIVAAAASRGASLARNRRLRPVSTIQTAIGVKHPRITQISRGFTADAFNLREFFHGRSRRWLRGTKAFFLVAAFAVPALLVAASLATGSAAALAAAFAVQMLGLFAERWFFFAEANHPQNLYYQAVA